MILTITPNPALDITHTIDVLTPGESHSVGAVTQRAGGKGVNVATTLACLGYASAASGPVGQDQFTTFSQQVRAAGVTDAFVPSPNTVRRSIAIVTPSETTVLNEAGAQQPPRVWNELEEVLRSRLRPGDVVSVSGSLPPNCPTDLIRRLVETATAVGARTVLDVRGPALTRALAARPAIVTPNAAEAAETTGVADPLGAARALVTAGAGAAVVSNGAAGLIVVHGSWALSARLPTALSGNPTGAGDALTAALCARLAELRAGSAGAAPAPAVRPDVAEQPARAEQRAPRAPAAPADPVVSGDPAVSGEPSTAHELPNDPDWWRETARWAVAWSGAAVLQPVAGVVDPADVATLEPTVVLEEFS